VKRSAPPPDPRFYPVFLRYSRGEVSAYDAACDIQDLSVPGFEDPSASEVVLWAKMAGFGIPTPSEEEARAEAEAILARSSGTGLIDNIPHTRVTSSPIHGRGLFAEIDFRAGQILGALDGQVIRHAEHPDAFDQEWNAISTELLLVRAYPTKYRYINHAWTPNCRIEERDTTVRAVRDIHAREELTLDYTAQPLPPEYLALERTAFLRRGAGSR
jgi:hypothetical protein